VLKQVDGIAHHAGSFAMLARTHGQPATPTTLGKEFAVFSSRLKRQIQNIDNVQILAKFNGATGTYAADNMAYPDIDWPKQMQKFVELEGLEFNPLTTQIEPHDWIARLCNELALAGAIMTDLSRDCWQYISMGYLKQIPDTDEVSSSTMPHKVNPIAFEKAEANFGVANALLRHLSEKLPISRLQRDLSDSSSLRSLSEALGHFLVATKSLSNGLSKVTADEGAMLSDLENEWAILMEAVQTIMRKNGIADAYDQMKKFSRDKKVTKEDIHSLIEGLDIDPADKKRLMALTPATYIGLAAGLAKH
jgi:adenylosuccinate lyase